MSLKKLLVGLSVFTLMAAAVLPVSANNGGNWNKDMKWRGMHGKWDKDWKRGNDFRFNRQIIIRNNNCDHGRDWQNWIGIGPGWNGIYW